MKLMNNKDTGLGYQSICLC